MNKQQLAAKIWESANKMRSKIEANEYKDYILGFIFYKYLSEAEKKYVYEQGGTEEELKALSEADKGNVDYIKNSIGYFISYDNLFSTWIDKGSKFTVGNVNDAMNAFSRNISVEHKKVFSEIFTVLQTGLGKLGDTPASQSKAIRELIVLINDIPMDKKQDYDVLGFIYEYLISQFAANAGKKAGEFYTPHEVSLLMSEIVANHLKNKKKIKIYDPTSGSGSLLINIGKAIKQYGIHENDISYYAQELKVSTYNLTRMNLVMRGILISNIFVRNADTLENDWPIFSTDNDPNTYTLLRVNAVVSNPPYSQNWDPTDKKNDKRYKDFGVAPKSKADYAFLLHDLYHLEDDGIMTIVLPHGVLFRGGEEGQIRKNLIEKNHIDAIIGLPANIFFGTGIPTIVMVLKRKRDNDDTLIIDASKHFTKEGKNNKLKANDIKRIVDTIKNRASIEKYSRCVTRKEIRDNDYNLNIPRYVDSSEEAENFDIYASMYGGIPQNELKKFDNVFNEIKGLKKEIFEDYNKEYAKVKTSKTIKELVFDFDSTKEFFNKFKLTFEDLSKYLIKELISNCEKVELNKEETVIGEKIFSILQDEKLIDKYAAYQLLDDQWQLINNDIEIIQTEGFESTKIVDPNTVIKKKGDEEVEVQDGWKGHILPFDLVQATYLTKETEALQARKSQFEERESEITELVEKLAESEEGQSILNEDNTALDSKLFTAKLKEIQQEVKKNETVFEEDSTEKAILKIEDINAFVKLEKKEITKDENELHNKTKTTIEALTDDQVKTLLNLKWIKPIIDALNNLPQEFLNNFVQSLEKIQNKYKDSLNDLETQINETSSSLCSMMDDLTGSDFDMKGLSELKSLLMGN